MIGKMLSSALFAGCAAGLLAAVLHFAFVQKYILLGEAYESGAAVHWAGLAPGHADADAGAQAGAVAAAHSHESAAPHSHEAAVGTPLTRNALTVLFSGLVYVAYAMILVAGFGLARAWGKVITAREGLLWGIAGFAAFQLAPALGLSPELPGTLAGDLGARQIWWWGTALSTATALALIGYGRGAAAIGAALVLLAAPHLIGAPALEGFSGVAPPEVAAAFAARVLGMGLAAWAVLGWIAGALWARDPV